MIPDSRQNIRAELVYENRVGGYPLPESRAEDLYVVFRDNSRNVDMVYKMKCGSGELIYILNGNPQTRDSTSDHQLIIDVSDGGLQKIDIFRPDLADELLGALQRRDLTIMSKVLNANPALSNVSYNADMTLLMMAEDPRVARILAEHGANLNAKDIYGNTPLHYAASYNRRAVLELLIEKRANLNAKNSDGDTPLHLAVLRRHMALADYMVEHGADSNIKNNFGETAMSPLLHRSR